MNLNELFAKLTNREFGLCTVGLGMSWWLIEQAHVKYGVVLASVSLASFTVCRTVQKLVEGLAKE